MIKKAADNILMILKMKGEVTLNSLADEIGMTKEGARLHLTKLSDQGLVNTDSKSKGVGRPLTYYSLTDKGLSKFPDSHAQVTVEILQSVRKLLGENALDLLINDREKKVYEQYETVIGSTSSVEELLERLTEIRTKEGYMAEWKKEGNEYFLIENHCPICAAATECQGFCRSELKNFRQLLGEDYYVERMQHIVSGAQRCQYRISQKTN